MSYRSPTLFDINFWISVTVSTLLRKASMMSNKANIMPGIRIHYISSRQMFALYQVEFVQFRYCWERETCYGGGASLLDINSSVLLGKGHVYSTSSRHQLARKCFWGKDMSSKHQPACKCFWGRGMFTVRLLDINCSVVLGEGHVF